MILRKAKLSATVNANIIDAECRRVVNDKSSTNDCLLKLNYQVKGEEYDSITNIKSSTYYQPGNSTTIRYDPENPKEISLMPGSKMFGWISIGIGIFIIFSVVINWYLATRYKFAAAATGIGTGINMAT